jgi:general secretion pathway protein K
VIQLDKFIEQSIIKKSKGIALITVMLIVSLCAIIAAQMTTRLHMQMQRSTNINFNQQAYWYAMGAEAFAKRVLLTTVKKDKDTINLGQIWAQGETSYPVDFGTITGEISDLQSCLNLNALRSGDSIPSTSGGRSTKSPGREVFENLLIALNIEGVGQFEAESLADALKDWLDEDSRIASAGGAEDDDYASRNFPYLAANHFLASLNELRIVEHFNPAIIEAIKPYVCILPQLDTHKININTINTEQPELIEALLGVNSADAQSILSARPADGFKSVAEFIALPEVTSVGLKNWQEDQFVVDSDYFLLKTTASFNQSFYKLNVVIQIIDNKETQVVSRSVGYY